MPQRIEAHCFQDEKVTAVWSGWTHLVAKTGEGATESLGLARVAVRSLVLGVEDLRRGTLSTGKWRTWHLRLPSARCVFSSVDYSFALRNARLH